MTHTATPRIISCGILRDELQRLREMGAIHAKVHFLSENLHYDYNRLERGLSQALETYEGKSPGGIIVVYGDVCLGFKGEMIRLVEKFHATKVVGLNCIDCLLGGKGKLLELDPHHKYLYLHPGFIRFFEKMGEVAPDISTEMFSRLDGIILLDTLGNLDSYQGRIQRIAQRTGLPILETKHVGLDGLKNVLREALNQHAAESSGA